MKGRMAPPGLTYINSWVSSSSSSSSSSPSSPPHSTAATTTTPPSTTSTSTIVGWCCWQVMETNDRSLIDQWTANWDDIVDFEVHPVMTSPEAAKAAKLYMANNP
ncbi:hypothetical protein Pelo_19625 [Pelomyxa schiedti]|nr:hypothetical protein Pelo_19625 [Pelomyxa schiedti]